MLHCVSARKGYAAPESEYGLISLDLKILNGDHFAAGQQTAQLLIICVGVRRTLRPRNSKASGKDTQNNETRYTQTKYHPQAPEMLISSWPNHSRLGAHRSGKSATAANQRNRVLCVN